MKQKDMQADGGGKNPSPARIGWRTATLLFWPAAIAGAVLDLWSKQAVFERLAEVPQQQFVVVEGFLRLILRENEGAAFSIFRGWTGFLVLISIAALTAEIVIFFLRTVHSRLVLLAIGCTAGGIAGNLYDRLFNEGSVRDFIDVVIPLINYHWPTFNVADSLLCIGVGLMIIANFTSSTAQTPDLPQKEE